MNSGKTIFTQLMEFLPEYEFRKCVNRYDKDRGRVYRGCCPNIFISSIAIFYIIPTKVGIQKLLNLHKLDSRQKHSGMTFVVSATAPTPLTKSASRKI